MHDEKIHYKMYKDGKQWAFAAIVTFTFTIVPMTMMTNHAAAASVEEPAVNLQNRAATSSSSAVTLSASAAVSHSAAATTNPQSNTTTVKSQTNATSQAVSASASTTVSQPASATRSWPSMPTTRLLLMKRKTGSSLMIMPAKIRSLKSS